MIMKKFSLLGLCLAAGLTLSAQADVVKDVEHALKEGSPNYEAALKSIQPALTNPETKDLAQPWYLAGKAGFGLYDQLYIQESLGNALDAAGKKKAGQALIDGYNYYFTAIPLDAQPDAKGKVKPKYTKDMVKTAKNNYGQLRNAGAFLFEAQDFKGAYDAWELYVTLPSNPVLGKEAPASYPDTIVGNSMYYQMLAALSADMNAEALAKVPAIDKTGYKNVDVYVYGIEAARRMNDTVAMLELAKKGYDIYGTQNIQFIGQLINDRLNAKDYPACEKLVNEALAATSDAQIQSQLYDILGVVYEDQSMDTKAMECFDKAISIDPNMAKAYYDKGRIIYNQAVKLDEESDGSKAGTQKVVDALLQAADLFEKAYGMDEDNLGSVPNLLYRLYYRLGQGYEDKADYWKDK